MSDATFEDGAAARPLRLQALDAEDLQVLSALAQDAVFPGSEMRWDRTRRRFALLLNRFRWEDRRDPPERAQAVLAISDVTAVQTDGTIGRDAETVLSLLSLTFVPGADGTGRVILTLAGDGAIAVEVETLDVVLRDVTKPYLAPSRSRPEHPE